jgi:enoyl-CoA hydratase/carnithine racemase
MTTLPELRGSRLTLGEDGVATLTFARDDVRNALTGTGLIPDIVETCDWANRNPAVGALILTGDGKAFSSGGNVAEMRERRGMFGGTPIEVQDGYRRGIQQMTLAMYRLEVPAIAAINGPAIGAINGPAIGAGLDLTCMCDIRIGSTYARVGETFVNLGIIPGDGGAWFLPRLIGIQRAAELMFSGRIVAPEEALALGLFMEVTEPEALLERAREHAARFASRPREALRIAKRLLWAGQRMELGDFLDYCASQQSLCHTSEEHAEALQAFLQG